MNILIADRKYIIAISLILRLYFAHLGRCLPQMGYNEGSINDSATS